MILGLEKSLENIQREDLESVGTDSLTAVHDMLKSTEEKVRRLIEAREVLKAARSTDSPMEFQSAVGDAVNALFQAYENPKTVTGLLVYGIDPVVFEDKAKDLIKEYEKTQEYWEDKTDENPEWESINSPREALVEEVGEVKQIVFSLQDKRRSQ